MTWNGKKRHCPKGHPYFGPNLYVTPSTGHRVCRACRKANRVKNSIRKITRQQTLREEVKRLELKLIQALAMNDTLTDTIEMLRIKLKHREGGTGRANF